MTDRTARRAEVGVLMIAAVLAVVGARPFAGGWNDGSRLASVESLAERGTLRIDDSTFVNVPPNVRRPVYDPSRPGLVEVGTRDKLLVGGHYYSDKSPVPTVLMAGVYRTWLSLGGPTMADRPDWTIAALTVLSAGVPFAFAAWCVSRIARLYGLPNGMRLLFLLSFVAATVALPYTRHVNNGVMLLGAVAPLCVLLAELPANPQSRWDRFVRPTVIGMLAGLGYAIDLGVGPPLMVAVGGYVVYRTRSIVVTGVMIAGTLPCVVLHHVLNYAVGGTIMPANAVLEYLDFPGSPFDAHSATGGLKHGTLGTVVYGMDLLVGKKGFLTHNWPLFLATLGAIRVAWHYPAHRPALGFCLAWAGLSWLAYAATSTNLSGICCSVRWFVPLIVPGYWTLAIVMKEYPRFRPDLSWLTAVGSGMTLLMWLAGPWMPKLVPGLWGWVGVAGIGWAVIRYRDELAGRIRFGAVRPRFLTTRSSSGV